MSDNIPKRISSKDYYDLEAALLGTHWPTVLKYAEYLCQGVCDELQDAKTIDGTNLVYLKGKTDGARALMAALRDLKDYYRKTYDVKDLD